MTGLAAGLALEGRIVFTYSIANFPVLRCLEQIRNDAAYHGANVNVVAVGGGFSYGALGMSHHATEDLAILRAVREITVVAPSDDWETRGATRAIAATAGTCYLRLDRVSDASAPRTGEHFALGRARVVTEGSGVAIICCGSIIGEVKKAAELVRGEGIRPSIVSLHTVNPIDADFLITLARAHPAVLTVEEHVLNGGLGGAVAEVLADAGAVPERFKRLGLPNRFTSEVGSQNYLLHARGLDSVSIAGALRELTA